MNKLAKLIKELSYEDASLIEKDLKKGTIGKLIKKRMIDARRERLTLCPTCNKPVQEGLGFYLEFGPASLRKKATFDTSACLQYFLSQTYTPKE